MWLTTIIVLSLALAAFSQVDQTPSWAEGFPRLEACIMECTETKCPNTESTKVNWGPFDFGDIKNNIISFKDKGKKILVICTANYPLKVFLDYPEDRVTINGQEFERVGTKKSANYTRKLILESVGSASLFYMEATVRCEKADNKSANTELYVNYYSQDDGKAGIVPRKLPTAKHSPARNIFMPKKLNNGCNEIVPCKASKFYMELSLEDFRQQQDNYVYNFSQSEDITKYDPRIGEEVEVCSGTPKPQYNCSYSLDNGTTIFTTVKHKDQGLEIDSSPGDRSATKLEAVCRSKIDPDPKKLTIWHRECTETSLSLCETAISRNLDYGIGEWKPLRYVQAGARSTGPILSGRINKGSGDSLQGAIMCFYKDESNGETYIDITISYFFTGADGKLYLIPSNAANYSKGLPPAALMVVTAPSPDPNTGTLTPASCKVASFLLADHSANFGIKLKLKNGKEVFVRNNTAGKKVTSKKGVELPTTVVIPADTKAEDIEKVHCSADFLHSFDEVAVDQDAFTPPVLAGPTILVISLGALGAIIILVGFLVFAVLKYWRSKNQVVAVTHFFAGNSDQTNTGKGINADALRFGGNYIIKEKDLIMDNARVLGEGFFGKAIRGIYHDLEVAIKSVKPDADVQYFQEFLKEVKIMAYLTGNANVIRFFGAVVDKIGDVDSSYSGVRPCVCYAVLELSPFGDLLAYIQKLQRTFEDLDELKDYSMLNRTSYTNTSYLNSLDLVSFAFQIASGMEYVGQKKVIHGDLAARNILVFPNNVAKITDFGLSKKLYGQDYTKKGKVALPWKWMAIETLRYMRFSTKSDVWSYGVTMWEIFSLGQVPFTTRTWTNDFLDELEHSNLRLPKPRKCPDAVYEILLQTWLIDPDDRPTFTFLKDYFQCFYTSKKTELLSRGSTHLYLYFEEASQYFTNCMPGDVPTEAETSLTHRSINGNVLEHGYQNQPIASVRGSPTGPEPVYSNEHVQI